MLRDPLNIALRMEAAVDALLRVVKRYAIRFLPVELCFLQSLHVILIIHHICSRGRATDSSAQRMEVEGVVQQYKGARRFIHI
jgi:hypothetical protein